MSDAPRQPTDEELWNWSAEYREEICIWRDSAAALADVREKYRKLWLQHINRMKGDE